MRVRGVLFTVALSVAVGASCDRREPEAIQEPAASSASTTTTSEVEAADAATVVTGDAAVATTTNTKTTTTAARGAKPTTTTAARSEREDTPSVLTYREFFERRRELVGEAVSVRGRVLFVTNCPPPQGGQQSACVSTAYLADETKTGIPAYEQEDAVPLHRDGRAVACDGQSGPDFECGGFRHGDLYVVSGEPTQLVLGGKPSDRIVLEVTNQRPV